MNPGLLNHKLTLYRRERGQNPDGSPKCEEERLCASVWASRRCVGNPDASDRAGGVSNTSQMIFRVRSTPELCRLLKPGLKLTERDCNCLLTYKLESWQPCDRGFLELQASMS